MLQYRDILSSDDGGPLQVHAFGSCSPVPCDVQAWTEFTDQSGRANYVATDTFVPLR